MPYLTVICITNFTIYDFIFRFYDLEIGAENRFYNLGEVRIDGAPQNNFHTSFRPAGLEHPKQLKYLILPRRVRAGYY